MRGFSHQNQKETTLSVFLIQKVKIHTMHHACAEDEKI